MANNQPKMNLLQKLDKTLRKCDDLLSRHEIKRHETEGRLNHFDGHCYIAAEVCYHLLGGKEAGCKSFVIPKQYIGNTTHWFITVNGKIFDPTKKQFGKSKIPYDKAKCCGFLTIEPSRRARELMKRLMN